MLPLTNATTLRRPQNFCGIREVMRMKVAEIIAVGNELLIGDVLDTNTHWLCRRLTRMGVTVRRAVLVRDDEDAIAAEVRGALQRDTD